MIDRQRTATNPGTLLFLAMICGALLVPSAMAQTAIDPEADVIIREMCRTLRETEAIHVVLRDTFELPGPDGALETRQRTREIAAMRPRQLKIEVESDSVSWALWKNGATVTFLDRVMKTYVERVDMRTIEEAIQFLQRKYEKTNPTADLFLMDVESTLTEGWNEIHYRGLQSVNGADCHHLALIRDDISYDFWVNAGEERRPEKVVVTYRLQPGQPQFTMELIERRDPSALAPGDFKAVIPDGAVQTDSIPGM